MNWSLTRDEFERRLAEGYVRVGRHQPDGPQEYFISYLRTGPIDDIQSGQAVVVGRNDDGSVVARYPEGTPPPAQRDTPERIAPAESYFAAVPATVIEGGNRAYYSPSADTVHVPPIAQFDHVAHHYGTRTKPYPHRGASGGVADRPLLTLTRYSGPGRVRAGVPWASSVCVGSRE